MKKATLKQIADMAGVSMTTVHRALNGKGGCSKAVEEHILRIAREQGYTINLAAASLRKPPLNIALIFPFRDNGGRFFLDRILDGYLEYRRKAAQYNVVFQEFLLRSNDRKLENYVDMEYPELETVLRQIYQEMPVHYDGVVIYGKSVTRRAEAMLNRIVGSGTKVVVIERSLDTMEDCCVVKADEIIGGNMAAEILDRSVQESGTVLIINQKVPGGDLSGETCARTLQHLRPDLKAVQLPLIMNADESESVVDVLNQYPDLVGLYVTSGRHSNSALTALKKTGLRPTCIIASEMFDESYQALQDNTVDVVIDKRPEKIGYYALHVLLESLYKQEPLPVEHNITPRIVIRANSGAYYVKKGSRYDEDEYTD